MVAQPEAGFVTMGRGVELGRLYTTLILPLIVIGAPHPLTCRLEMEFPFVIFIISKTSPPTLEDVVQATPETSQPPELFKSAK